MALTLVSCAKSAPTQPLPGNPPQVTYSFDEKQGWSHLVKQCDFGPRPPGTEAHKKCRDYIFDEMKKSCDSVRLQEFSHKWSVTGQKMTMWNVIGEQNWKDAKVRVLLTAHWDTRPYADQDDFAANRKKPVLGANDGASGVSVLLELMRATKGKLPKDVGVMYFMNDGEDLGPELEEMFLGAIHFAKNLPNPKPDYGILLDMIGDKDLRVPVEPNGLAYARDFVLAFYRNAEKAGLKSTFPMEYGPSISDDHLSLNEAGIPTMDLIDFSYGPNHGWWHTMQDTVDKCSAESLGKVGKAVESWLMQQPPWKPKPNG